MLFLFSDGHNVELDIPDNHWLQAEFGERTEISYDDFKAIVLKSTPDTEEQAVAVKVLQKILNSHDCNLPDAPLVRTESYIHSGWSTGDYSYNESLGESPGFGTVYAP